VVLLLFVGALLPLLLGYVFYGRFLRRQFELDDRAATPATTRADGVDFVPAPRAVLLGHHFSSIAGAGPIVGPIVAAKAFGWAPTLAWIVLGSIFVGGVHDLGALVASIRHRARSVAEIARERMSPLSHRLFLVFIWLALVYVLTVFVDLTASTFVQDVPLADGRAARGGAVATASVIYIGLAVLLGLTLYRLRVRTLWASLVFVPLVFGAIAVGVLVPLEASSLPALLRGDPGSTWKVILILYCLSASVLPVWLLLQPRDYLSSYLLYACVAAGLIGVVASAGSLQLHFPAYRGFDDAALGLLFPALFINVACGACSGFHSIVASGTTAKQLARESDAVPVAYGSMIVEGVLATIAVVALVTALPDDPALASPTLAFAAGIGRFALVLGIPTEVGTVFGLLAVSTFLLTTLDTATRLGRYVLEEFLDGLVALPTFALRLLATVATVAIPLTLSLLQLRDASGALVPSWKAIWPVFGATNQLLAALALLVVTVWLTHLRRPRWFVAAPMVAMFAITLVAVAQLVWRHGLSLIGAIAAGLLVLALVLLIEGVRVLRRGPPAAPPAPVRAERPVPEVNVC
jgi:carbon starvation protein